MKGRTVWRSALAAIGVSLIGFGVWVLSLPATPTPQPGPQISHQEVTATIEALRPSKRERPLIAIVGANEGTEITDYLMPFGILRRADVADVVALGTKAGTVKLYPGELHVVPQATTGEFDAQHPEGADYVIVPALRRNDDPAVLEWVNDQAAKEAIVIGVCVGATVVANAGLLDGKRATTHWFRVSDLREHAAIHYVPDRRLVVDEGVATTTGITASMPMTLTLIEAIAGRDRAHAVARELGIDSWDARHNSDAFKLTRDFAVTAIRNRVDFWRHEQLGISVVPGVDEVSLALAVDAWSRTYRSRAVTFAASAGPLESRGGIRLIPGEVASKWPAQRLLPEIADQRPADVLVNTLDQIAHRYGPRTRDFVAMQLEYPLTQSFFPGDEAG